MTLIINVALVYCLLLVTAKLSSCRETKAKRKIKSSKAKHDDCTSVAANSCSCHLCENLTEQVIGRHRNLRAYYGKNCQNCHSSDATETSYITSLTLKQQPTGYTLQELSIVDTHVVNEQVCVHPYPQ